LSTAELLSPGSDRSQVSDAAVLQALIDVEGAYLASLVSTGVAPALPPLQVEPPPLDTLDSGETGNPVIALLAYLRTEVDAETAAWLHRGATSQDIVDSALMLIAQRSRVAIAADLSVTIDALARLADEHRATVAAARTLTQHATPTTLGLRFAIWLSTALDARDHLAAVSLPAQLGGAAGTLAALVEIAGADKAAAVPAAFARELGLEPATPWHSNRTPVTRLGDALCGLTDALGMIASNVLALTRSEVGELAEPAAEGRGVSSTMPQKRNPVLSVLLRANALRAPGLLSTLHLCAANSVDERSDGAWHAEWATLAELLALASGSARLAAQLTAGLRVDGERVAANLGLTGSDILAERTAISGSPGNPEDYLGLANEFIDRVLSRVRS
jgi:3-carboxy-cis,cis-muconate cycloisomerase